MDISTTPQLFVVEAYGQNSIQRFCDHVWDLAPSITIDSTHFDFGYKKYEFWQKQTQM